MLGSPPEELATPAVLVDLDVLERNVARMAERAREAGVGLRPHAKTHKTLEIAPPAALGGRARPVARQDRRGRGLRRRRLRRHLPRLPHRGRGQGPPPARARRSRAPGGRRRQPGRRAHAGRALPRRRAHARRPAEGRRRLPPRRRAARATRRPSPRQVAELPACGCAASSRTPATATWQRARTASTRSPGTRASGWSRPPPACGGRPRARRGLGGLDADGARSRCASPASPSAAPATTSSTTPRRWRSGPAASRTAR